MNFHIAVYGHDSLELELLDVEYELYKCQGIDITKFL